MLGVVLVALGSLSAVEGAGEVRFTLPPTVEPVRGGLLIRFRVDRPTDVAVEVLNERGEVVRHLAAGMLGPNAPEPLKPNSLEQTLLWDRTDDAGRPVTGAVAVRVGIGLTARYAGEYGGGKEPVPGLPVDGRDIDRLRDLAAGPDGTLYLLGGYYHPHLDRFPHLIALDADLRYLREVYPPSRRLIPERTPGLPTLRLGDGSVVPRVGSWWDLFIPEMTTAGRMVVTPDGRHLLVATTQPDYVKERRVLFKLGTDGSIPADCRTLRLPPGMATLGLGLAVSPDGRYLYVSGTTTTRPVRPLHAVYRLALDGSNRYEVFFGEEGKAGSDEKHLNLPCGVAVAGDGTVYLADFGNDRLLIIDPTGRLKGSAPVEKPFAVAVDPRGVYVLSVDWVKKRYTEYVVNRRLTKFTLDGREVDSTDVLVKGAFGYGRIPMRCAGLVVVERGGRPVVLVGGTSFPDGCNGYPYGYSYGVVEVADEGMRLGEPRFIEMSAAVYTARKRARQNWRKWRRMGFLQRDGYRYTVSYRSSTDPSVVALRRYTADGREAPFPAAGPDKWVKLLGRPSSRNWYRVAVNYQGDILVEYYDLAERGPKGWRRTACVDLLGTDGAVKRRKLVFGLREGTYGLKVDREGNIYVADHLPPAGRLAPAEIEDFFARRGEKVPWTYLSSYGSVFKIPPTGGGFTWGRVDRLPPPPRADIVRQPGLVWEPAHYSKMTARVEGVVWQFFGASPLPATLGKCICSGIAFDLDQHARIFIPDAYRMCVHVLDKSGNYLLRIGGYGNQDDARGRLLFARPRFVRFRNGRLVVTDPQNGRAVLIDLRYASERTCPVR